ncbi:uncharacterized protein LOC133503137 isoform X2 [Syngnathoides biaculeatus]|uniref:uncharacterized protein LOC133503137 isoform X2 n=1 Tax=Syngnathoides biaculeatus TaxID=300417 RepID=UPI002ADDB7D6|nr:uncharacterized protein LOC133503137 isoform X2 [Syngnathoides biaculeatus]XP_061680361.1 uncharacterized protein LOC133503137 isoform X2 [Syngnathoides biaculeatus]
MCKVRNLRTLVRQRRNAAVEEILELFERTIAEYEGKLLRSKEENEPRQRKQLDAALKPSNQAAAQRVPAARREEEEEEEEVRVEQQEEPADSFRIKEEAEDVRIGQDGERLRGPGPVADVNSWTGVLVKSEDDDGTQRVLAGRQEEQAPHPGIDKEEKTGRRPMRSRSH